MTLGDIGLGYAGIGVILAVALHARRRLAPSDAVLLLAVWPIAVPLILTAARDPDESELVAAIARASASPLAPVLPDAETARVLQSRVREARARLTELDRVLARPDFDPTAAEQRATELTSRGSAAAAATAQLRVRTLGQLRGLRKRYRTELDEVRELIAQLVTQAELVRLQPSTAQASGELVRELVSRVEGLGDLLAYQASLETGEDESTPNRP
jgi:hypothetical protein